VVQFVIDANGAKVLAEAGKQIGSNIGLAGVVGALTGATASVLKSAPIPPMVLKKKKSRTYCRSRCSGSCYTYRSNGFK
jgi:hypothetical protein